MKLSMNKAYVLLGGLAQFDGYDKVVKEGEKERVVRSGFTLSAKTKLTIALMRKKLASVLIVCDERRRELFQNFAENNEAIADPVKAAEFRKQEKELLDHEEDFDLPMLTFDELRLDDKNNANISPTMLVQIAPVLSELSDPPKENE